MTNTLLHAGNALMVWATVLLMSGRRQEAEAEADKFDVLSRARAALEQKKQGPASVLDFRIGVATLAALLFAIHPLQIEVIAWVNGRMMLLSTLFALGAVVALSLALDRRSLPWSVLVVVFVVLSAMSKIRVGLPFLLLLVPLARRQKFTSQLIVIWSASLVVTGVFAWINYQATQDAGMFSGAVQNLHGPRVIRAILALSFYVEHFFVPLGLASWYPTPGIVAWGDPSTQRALIILAPVAIVALVAGFKSATARWCLLWCAATMAVTIQLVPTRNALAADRYMYLPMVGACWVTAFLICRLYAASVGSFGAKTARSIAWPAGAAVATALVGLGWHTASFYENPIDKSFRIASLHPNTPHVWERAAWALQNAGESERAIEYAKRELVHDDANVRSAALQLIGVAQFSLGRRDEGIATLRQAVSANPASNMAKFRLAQLLDESGASEEAVSFYETAVENAPLHDPGRRRLAALYQRLGRLADSRAMYERVLENNPYDIAAIMALAEMDIRKGDEGALESAKERLQALLKWRANDVDALANLSVVYVGLGLMEEAIAGYRKVLQLDPGHVTAAFNLAGLFRREGQDELAWQHYEIALSSGPTSREQIIMVHDFLVDRGREDKAVQLWEQFTQREPHDRQGWDYLAWARALADDPGLEEALQQLAKAGTVSPLGLAATIRSALAAGEENVLLALGDKLCATEGAGSQARQRLLAALDRYDQKKPNNPWTYCLAGQVLLCDSKIEEAEAFLGICNDRCISATCREVASTLASRLEAAKASP